MELKSVRQNSNLYVIDPQLCVIGNTEVTSGIMARGLMLHSSPIVQELCESRGGRPGLSVLTSLLASVDVKLY